MGIVLDQDGNPLENVLIKVPQTIHNTRTKKNGTFLIDVPSTARSLSFTAKGKQYQQISIGSKTNLTVRMKAATALSEEADPEEGRNDDKKSVNRTFFGYVIDAGGTPVPGATVKVKDASISVVADHSGNFRIVIPKGKDILEVSAVGHTSKDVKAGTPKDLIEVELTANSVNMDEVVVVGYNTQKKVNLTGSVASVDFKDLQNTPQSNTINILAGRLPGVSVIQPGGQPGSDGGEVFVRGVGTLNDAEPLVIIDGVQSTLADLGNMSPAEISNVTVLKDASSAAIYGARGANGVILVATKDPGRKKMQVNLDAYYGIQSGTYIPNFVESWQWMVLHNEGSDTPTNHFPRYDSLTIEMLKAGQYNDTAANTKWPQELFRPAGISRFNIGISGGNQGISYQASLGYQDQNGLMRNTNAKRYNFRSNVRARITDNLESGFNIWGYQVNSREPFPGISNVMTIMNQARPYVPVKWSNGNYGVYAYLDGVNSSNPILQREIGRNDLESFKGSLQTYLKWNPVKGLSLKTSVTYSYGNDYRERFRPTFSYPDLAGVPTYINLNSQLQNIELQNKQLQWQSTAIYNKIIASKHAFTFLLGHEFTDYQNRQFSATGYNMPSNDLQVLGAAVSDFNVGGSKQLWALNSYFGRVNYVFNNKYLLEANLRADGSSRFPQGNKYGYFPSFSAGWIISKEKFFEPASGVFSLVKLRGGWGSTGNDRIGNFGFNQFIELGGFYGIGGSLQPAGSITGYANQQIKWETTTTTNLGVDLGVINNKLIVNFDLFNKLTEDILFRLPLPSSFGNVDAPIRNIGIVSNKGWELNIEHRSNIGKFFNYQIGLNVSYVKNRIEKLNNQETIYNTRFILREGEAINSYFGYVFGGLYKDSSDLEKYPLFSTNGFQFGTAILRDVNGDGVVGPDDRVVLGNANTPYTFGLSGAFSYKSFDMSFLFQGVSGKKIFIMDFGNRPGNAGATNFWREWWDNRYDAVNNPEGTWPVLKLTAPEIGTVTNSFFLQDASYIRLKNFEFGYTLPASYLQKLKMRTLRIYIAGQNVLTFSNLIKQIDPERSGTTVSNTTYPQTKVLSFGLNLGL
jgi:TonB-linked SusC/RagA family outer membrane protein